MGYYIELCNASCCACQYKHVYLLTYLLTYLPTSWSRVLEKLTVCQLVKKFPAFYGTRRFITAFKSARHLSLSWARAIQFMPTHPTFWISILILSYQLRLGLPSGLFPSGFPTKTLYTPFLSPYVLHASPPPFLIFLDLITWTILSEHYRSLSSSLCSILHSTVTSSLVGPNILLNTLFSNTLSLSSSLNVRDQVLHPYKRTGKITVLYILIFTFFDSKLEDKIFCTEWQQIVPDFSLLLIYSWIEFRFVKVVPKYLHSFSLS